MATEAQPQLSTSFDRYCAGEASHVEGLLPPDALALPVQTVVAAMRRRHGPVVDEILAGPARTPSATASLVPSPIAGDAASSWISRARMTGINVRTVGSFWRTVHYLLTVPDLYDSVHLLPIWEPGVVGSLYGMASWEINDEFLDHELLQSYPSLSTPESQLATVTALLHLDRRSVGLDVIPHTDRYSQIVLAQPHFFEWLRRRGAKIVDHDENLHEEVMKEILRFVERNGPAPRDSTADVAIGSVRSLFDSDVDEATRTLVLFGAPNDHRARAARREALISHLYERGYEPVPATMAPPFRGIAVDTGSNYVDAAGRTWYDYRITRPESMSRVFGPLTRYKFYRRLDNNSRWEIDFDSPRPEVFDYFASHVRDVQADYQFDFMRGDMSHVQMRPSGPPLVPDRYYDPLAYVKAAVRDAKPSFAYFAETFLAPPGVMGYGDEIDHLEASNADVTLGDLQSVAVGSSGFLSSLRRYLDIADQRIVVPSFTTMTADKDDPRFDEFYRTGNELRTFLSLVLPSLPSYTALGFELRDRHDSPAENEYYSKLYVFHEESGPKATRGPYRFGSNVRLFRRIERIRRFARELRQEVAGDRGSVQWLISPDATGESPVFAWSPARAGHLVFLANAADRATAAPIRIPVPASRTDATEAALIFSTEENVDPDSSRAPIAGQRLLVAGLSPGEARVYRIGRAGRSADER